LFAAHRTRVGVLVTGRCPTPGKQQYRSQAEANKSQRHRGGHDRLYPYECSTGEHWHVTHHTPDKQQRTFDRDTRAPGLVPTSNVFDGFSVRHVFTDEPVWIGRDVCDAIGISKYRDALAQLDGDERVSIVVDTPGGPQQMAAVTEAGLWSLLLISRSPKVQPFKRWLTHEVLPTIRKTGRYDPSLALPDRKTLAHWVVEAETRAELAEAKVAVLEPPAAAWNELADAAGDYSVADAAKILNRDPGISTGERKLFRFMSGIGWAFKRDGHWKAYQTQVNNGRLAEKPGRPFWHEGRGEMVNSEPTVRITPKGLAELHNQLGRGRQLALVVGS
jgi:anti-repressor protein